MANGIYLSVSGAAAQQKWLDVASHNLANANTPGFKAQRVTFAEVLADRGAAQRGAGSFVKIDEVRLDLTPGQLVDVADERALAIDGGGYMVVQGDGGRELYTRSTRLAINDQSQLTDGSGNLIVGEDGRPIRVSEENATLEGLKIDTKGTLTTASGELGKLKLVEFGNPKALRQANADALGPVKGSGNPQLKPATTSKVRQGYRESTSVNTIKCMTTVLRASRAYESFNRAISIFNQTDRAMAGLMKQ